VEFALIAPMVVMCALMLVGTLSLCLSTLQLNDLARAAARSAITADDPAVSAQQFAQLHNVEIVAIVNDENGLISIEARRAHAFPLLGGWLPRLTLRSSATMMREPPFVLE
jgi:hypothetical protein